MMRVMVVGTDADRIATPTISDEVGDVIAGIAIATVIGIPPLDVDEIVTVMGIVFGAGGKYFFWPRVPLMAQMILIRVISGIRG
ncbi:MAG TPA: hypothetical protein VFR12_04945 [Pyrinomonadaceae bacterium]|nr:hypothetical protein [Pyrinomonadaceae bacterium]